MRRRPRAEMPPGFDNPQSQMSGDFEAWLFRHLSNPVLGPLTGWHLLLAAAAVILGCVRPVARRPPTRPLADEIPLRARSDDREGGDPSVLSSPSKNSRAELHPALPCRFVYKFATAPGKTVTASHILVSSERECLEIKQKIDSGVLSFALAAQQHSTCPSGKEGGGLGTFGPGMMVPAFDRVCFDPSTPLGQAIGPVQTHFGYHLILIDSRKLGKTD